MKNNSFLYVVSFSVMTVFLILGIFLPEVMLSKDSANSENSVTKAPADYYSSSSTYMAMNASNQLSTYQKLNIISGVWESNTYLANSSDVKMSESEAILLCETSINELYHNSAYPCPITSGYDNWYSWTATLYRSVETTFNTYSVYYWNIQLVRFDNTETHNIYMTNDGTIFYAECNLKDVDSIIDNGSENNSDSRVNIVANTERIHGVNFDLIIPAANKLHSIYLPPSDENFYIECPYNVSSKTRDGSVFSLLCIGDDTPKNPEQFDELYSSLSSNDIEMYVTMQYISESYYCISYWPYSVINTAN